MKYKQQEINNYCINYINSGFLYDNLTLIKNPVKYLICVLFIRNLHNKMYSF